MDMKRLRIRSKVRFTIFAVVLILLVLNIVSAMAGMNTTTGVSLNKLKAVTVHAGDTLWSIAEKNNTSDMDVREFIDDIKEKNDLASAEIQEGQKLLIPVHE